MFRFARTYHSMPPHWAHAPRRPSRVVWFLIGAGTAAVIMKSHARGSSYCDYDRERWRGWGRCRRVGVEGMGVGVGMEGGNATANANANANGNGSGNGVGNGNGNGGGPLSDSERERITALQRGPWYPLPHPSSMASAAPLPADNTVPPAQPPLHALKNAYEGWEREQDERIEAEKAHVARVSRQAVDTMVELTEATLESVLTTAEALKAKLVEHRTERERQQKVLQEQMEAQRRDSPRSV